MRVWVNTSDEGWVMHGKERINAARAKEVADLLKRRLGWHTARGSTPPEPRHAAPGSPSGEVARKSPAKFD